MENNFLKNAEDSVRHALDHLFEDNSLSSFHHRKWFLFSAYHAAQMIFLYLMEKKESGFAEINNYPSLNTNLLKKVKRHYVEEPYLKELFLLLSSNLKSDRDNIWHRDSTQSSNTLNQEVFSLMGIMQYCALQEECDIKKLFKLKTDNLRLISESISLQEVRLFDEYRRKNKVGDSAFRYENFVTDLLKHKYPNRLLHCCDYCGAESILDDSRYCEACFTEVTWHECEECNEIFCIVEGSLTHKC